MIKLSKILNELISIDEIPKDYKIIFWNNGKIFFDYEKNLQLSFDAIRLYIDKNKKQLQFYSMDDWSEIRQIKKIQQALKDLIKAKIIDLSWTIIIPDKKSTVRSLGSVNIKNILKLDFDFNKYIPYSFHGTSTRYLPYILKNGILARSKTKTKPNWKSGYTEFSKFIKCFCIFYFFKSIFFILK